MTNGNGNKRRFFTIPLILLILLVILFYTELFVIGVRLYAAVVDSPRAERLLGDYYQNAARQNLAYANNFYTSSLNKYKQNLSTADDNQKAKYNMNIGRFYECGKGMEADLSLAKKSYEDAIKSAEATGDEAAKKQAEDALQKLNHSIQTKTPPDCPNRSNFTLFYSELKSGEY